jgi:Bacterial protein of unknown function (DUF899)
MSLMDRMAGKHSANFSRGEVSCSFTTSYSVRIGKKVVQRARWQPITSVAMWFIRSLRRHGGGDFAGDHAPNRSISRSAWVGPLTGFHRIGTTFNQDYRVSFTDQDLAQGNHYSYNTGRPPSEEAPGISVFYQSETGDIFHTYSCYARGVEFILGACSYLDLAPKGRNEEDLSLAMAWIRHHDKYEA